MPPTVITEQFFSLVEQAKNDHALAGECGS